MKITKKQIKKIILEELNLVMKETTRSPLPGVRFWNVEEASKGEENVLPLQFGGDLITIYSEKLTDIMIEWFDFDKDLRKLLLQKIPGGDSIHSLFRRDEQAASNIELLRSFSPEFIGYPPSGELRIGEREGNTGVKLEFNGKTFDVLNLKEIQKELKKDSDGELEVFLGYGMPSAESIGGLIAREVTGIGEDADVKDEASGYVSSFDPGLADRERGDWPTTATIRILKLIDDINDGTVRVKITQTSQGNPEYIYYEVAE